LLSQFHTHETVVSIKSATHSVHQILINTYQFSCNKTHSVKYLGVNFSKNFTKTYVQA